jgi:catechol 2,3-dioxygenase-like lactoylglutathione lyase family enzyme
MSIKGLHAMFYSPDEKAVREFFRDTLGFPADDVGDGWLIFDVAEAEIGCHLAERSFHGISFYCDDISATVKELESRGVEFTGPVEDQGFGLMTHFRLPDGSEVELYQPHYERKRTLP